MLGATSTPVDTHPGFTAVIESLPSLNRRRARPPKDAGTKRCMVTGPTQGGRHGWVISEGPLCITAVAAGKILELLGYRPKRHVTDAAFSAGCGVRRWDGFAMYDDWHLERAVAAIRSAADVPGNPEVADALAAAIASRQARARVAARKRVLEETEAARRREEEALVTLLEIELRALRTTDPEMGLLTAVEYITSDPGRRVALDRGCHAEDHSIGAAKDLALLLLKL
jgi:hypothetical protein